MAKKKGTVAKLLGIALVMVAVTYAFDPNWPVPLDQAPGKGAIAPVRPSRPASVPAVHSTTVEIDAADQPVFRWQSTVAAQSWRVVLLDENRHEIAWSEPLPATSYRPEGEFRDALQAGKGRYWFAVGAAAGKRLRSGATLVTPRGR